MVSGAPRDTPVYTIVDLPRSTRHVVLTPAVRWRVVVEKVEAVEFDVMLETVLRIRAAGETSPHGIADRLQLPQDLVRHLLAQSATHKLELTEDRRVVSSATKVAWIYRDVVTGELWPDTGDEMPPLQVTFMHRGRARFQMGTAGRPITVQCLLLDSPEQVVAEPTSIELARFSRASVERDRRTAVVGSGQRCLVASKVVKIGSESVIEARAGTPHLSLTRHLARIRNERRAVAEWLDQVPGTAAPPTVHTPLAPAVAELRAAVDGLMARHAEYDIEGLLSRTAFCLSRVFDHYLYFHGPDTSVEPMATPLPVARDRLGLNERWVTALARSAHGTPGHTVARLLGSTMADDTYVRRELLALAEASARWELNSPGPDADRAALRLAEVALDLGDRLLTELEHPGVEPTD